MKNVHQCLLGTHITFVLNSQPRLSTCKGKRLFQDLLQALAHMKYVLLEQHYQASQSNPQVYDAARFNQSWWLSKAGSWMTHTIDFVDNACFCRYNLEVNYDSAFTSILMELCYNISLLLVFREWWASEYFRNYSSVCRNKQRKRCFAGKYSLHYY